VFYRIHEYRLAILGIEIMPEGQRETRLRHRIRELLDSLSGPCILPFDEAAAKAYAVIVASARASGRSILIADGQIAAIARVQGSLSPPATPRLSRPPLSQ